MDAKFLARLAQSDDMRQPGEPRLDPLPITWSAAPETVRLCLDAEGGPAIDWEFHRKSAGFRFDYQSPRSPQRAFDQFLGLVGAPPERVAAFARRYGVLTFNTDGRIRPYLLIPPGEAVNLFDSSVYASGLKRPVPVEWYRSTAEYFRGLLLLAALATRGEPARQQDVAVVDPEWLGTPPPGKRVPPRFTWSLVGRHVNNLLDVAGVHLQLVHRSSLPGGLHVALSGHGVWGVLVGQLMFSVLASDRMAICSECNKPYHIRRDQRRPRTDRRNYCETHGPGERRRASNREASRRKRRRGAAL